MASVGEHPLARLGVPGPLAGPFALVAVPLLALGLGYLVPDGGVALAFRLAGAAGLVLFAPGALILRAIARPAQVGAILAGALAWSLVVIFFGLALTFAASGSLTLTIVVIGVVSAGALLAAARPAPAKLEPADVLAVLGIAAGGIALAAAIWWASSDVRPDDLLHVARVRKLVELPQLTSVRAVAELRGGELHPAYGFPLWHGALALVAKLAGVDASVVVRSLPALLSPVALVLAYGAGTALFRSWAGGVATAVATVAVAGFPFGGVGAFRSLALPPVAALLLLIPALLCLVFAHVRSGRRVELLTVGAAGLALAAVHPASAALLAVLLLGFLVARAVLAPAGARDTARIGGALLCVLVPAGLYVLWLLPAVIDTAGFFPTGADERRELARYADQLAGSFRVAADTIAQGGPAVAGAFIAIPLSVFAARRRYTAFVLGGSIAGLLVLLASPLFELLSDLVTVGQARRLALVLPLPFALAGAATLVGRFRLAGCTAALALGVGLQLAYPGSPERLAPGGPGWLAWAALAGGLAALLVGRRLGRRGPDLSTWTAAAAILFCLPVAVAGLREIEQDSPDPRALPPALVETIRAEVPAQATVLAPPAVSLRLAAAAPVHVVTLPPARIPTTKDTRPFQRRSDAARVLEGNEASYAEKALILERYGVTWLVVDESRGRPRYLQYLPPPTYADGRYALYRLSR